MTWSSMDETVAVVDSYGAVRTKGYGKTYIVAESLDGTKSAACEIKVLPMESRIKLRKINDQILENNSVNPDSSYRISVMSDDGKCSYRQKHNNRQTKKRSFGKKDIL